MTAPRSLGLVEAAALLRVHKNTLAARARARIIPGAKIGKEWAFLEADLVAYAHHSPGYLAQFANNVRKK